MWGCGGDVRLCAPVVLFPALDVLTVTPLNIITLGSNMIAAYYGDRCDAE